MWNDFNKFANNMNPFNWASSGSPPPTPPKPSYSPSEPFSYTPAPPPTYHEPNFVVHTPPPPIASGGNFVGGNGVAQNVPAYAGNAPDRASQEFMMGQNAFDVQQRLLNQQRNPSQPGDLMKYNDVMGEIQNGRNNDLMMLKLAEDNQNKQMVADATINKNAQLNAERRYGQDVNAYNRSESLAYKEAEATYKANNFFQQMGIKHDMLVDASGKVKPQTADQMAKMGESRLKFAHQNVPGENGGWRPPTQEEIQGKLDYFDQNMNVFLASKNVGQGRNEQQGGNGQYGGGQGNIQNTGQTAQGSASSANRQTTNSKLHPESNQYGQAGDQSGNYSSQAGGNPLPTSSSSLASGNVASQSSAKGVPTQEFQQSKQAIMSQMRSGQSPDKIKKILVKHSSLYSPQQMKYLMGLVQNGLSGVSGANK